MVAYLVEVLEALLTIVGRTLLFLPHGFVNHLVRWLNVAESVILLPGFDLLNLEDFVVILMVDIHIFCVIKLAITADLVAFLLERQLIV